MMLMKSKVALVVMLLAGIGAASDIAHAKKSTKSSHARMQSAPAYLPQGAARSGWSSNPYQNWDGWVPPPAHAGGVG